MILTASLALHRNHSHTHLDTSVVLKISSKYDFYNVILNVGKLPDTEDPTAQMGLLAGEVRTALFCMCHHLFLPFNVPPLNLT